MAEQRKYNSQKAGWERLVLGFAEGRYAAKKNYLELYGGRFSYLVVSHTLYIS
jgi:hypothetical protein